MAIVLPSTAVGDARLPDAFSGDRSWSLRTSAESGAPAPAWTCEQDRVFVVPGKAPALATYTVPAGGAGFYAIKDSFVRRDAVTEGTIDLRVSVQRAGMASEASAPVVVHTTLAAGELFDFDAFLGYLDTGDTLEVAVGPDGDATGDRTAIEFRVAREPSIPVSAFPTDAGNAAAPGEWAVLRGISAASPAARRLAWAPVPTAEPRLEFTGAIGESIVAFRAPQSGYYALHDAHLIAAGAPVHAHLYVDDESTARLHVCAEPGAGRVSLNAEIGYLARGRVVWLAFSGSPSAGADFAGRIVEWAPRRAPLRVHRGEDGLLDVLEPAAPREALDIPAERWVTVPAPSAEADATAALRTALNRARDLQQGEDYAGVRLERGRTYTVASDQVGGAVFALRNARRLVVDGNGATLRVNSPELTRRDLELFTLHGGSNVIVHEVVVTATSIPFTTGEILHVAPRGETTQTVTFRVDPGALDPLRDISRDGRNNAYAYDPLIPGRLALGSWTHYPGSGAPSIRATDTPGVFTHRVTRTGGSIEPGARWLIKNKRAGVVYLTTRGGVENVTLSHVDGRAAGGGSLRFWQTSGVNILDCRFEPDGDNWISSSADGIHGRGREGVWLENTMIRGVCEDIMNTYGQNMIVLADDDPDDAAMSIRMFTRSESFDDGALPLPTDENVAPGDQLVFFNPNTGRILGHARVLTIEGGRFTLSNPVAAIDPWSEDDGKHATMVYNTQAAARFFVRDSRLMDSMRYGIYIKARGGVVFGTQFEGLSAPAIFAVNEPEWPEGPPATHLWVQGCVFSQNNFGYMPRHRDYLVVDPADISVYTRRFRDPAEPDDFRAYLARDQYANSHVKLLDNVFHDWRGMGISVRNARNVRIDGNLFLAPVDDPVMRRTLADDPTLGAASDARGRYAAIHLDSVSGVRLGANRFLDLPANDHAVATGPEAVDVARTDETATAANASPVVSLSFDEWFGRESAERPGAGQARDRVTLGAARHCPGRLGGGLSFSGGDPARVHPSADLNEAADAFTFALWVRPSDVAGADQAVYIHGTADGGVALVLTRGRWRAGHWQGGASTWLDLGPAHAGQWQHLALVLGREMVASQLVGYVDGLELARAPAGSGPFGPAGPGAFFGGPAPGSAIPPPPDQPNFAPTGFRGELDELQILRTAANRAALASLALRATPLTVAPAAGSR